MEARPGSATSPLSKTEGCMMASCPDLEGFFETRQLRGRAWRKIRPKRAPVSFPVTVYNRWGGVQSISWRAA